MTFGRKKAERHLEKARNELDEAAHALRETEPRKTDRDKADVERRLSALEVIVQTIEKTNRRRPA